MLAVAEKLLKLQVDGPDGAMEVDRPEQLGSNGNEPHQGREAPLVDRQPAVGEEL